MNREIQKLFSQLIMSEKPVKIKLLGDSITHGVGGTGFVQNGEPIAAGFRRNPDGYCWAKQFKEHMESRYNCIVTNNACTGTTIQFISEHFDELVSADDDIIICTIGTNNRHQYHYEEPHRSADEQRQFVFHEINRLYDKFVAIGKAEQVVFMANIPASANDEKDGEGYSRLIHMPDIFELYTKASHERGFLMIPMYMLFMNYCEMRGISFDSLLADGLHPNDAGYDVMFKLLMDEIGMPRKVPRAEF